MLAYGETEVLRLWLVALLLVIILNITLRYVRWPLLPPAADGLGSFERGASRLQSHPLRCHCLGPERSPPSWTCKRRPVWLRRRNA